MPKDYTIPLIAIVNLIFHVSDFLRSFIISMCGLMYGRKYGLFLLRYSSIDSVLFPSPLLSYSI